MGKLTDLIKDKKVLVSDGAWGTLMYEKGLAPGECPELWCAERPDDIFDIAMGYIDAGADVIETCSFGANAVKLAEYGLENRAHEINTAAARLSKKAAGQKLVMGSMGSTGKMLLMGDITEKEMYDAFYRQAKALYEGGADAICIETMLDPVEAGIAVNAVKDAVPLDVACTFAFDLAKDGTYRTIMGATPVSAAEAALAPGADVIGANCGNGMQRMAEIVAQLREAYPDTPILIHANAGLPVTGADGSITYPETPEETAMHALTALENGASVIGGCCGTTPAHIAALRKAVDKKISSS